MKRLLDLVISGLGLLLLLPLFLLVSVLIWAEDRRSPFYLGKRIGRDGKEFRMVKLRSMAVNAERTGVDSTAAGDPRITRVGGVIRRFKLDELSQLINVFAGQMSLVGPRPQVPRDAALYTEEERRLLSIRPGVTDFSSIVFADEGDILAGASDPDLRYNQIIRPYKSRLGLHYVAVRTVALDVRLVLATALNSLSRKWALTWVGGMLERTGAPPDLVAVARRVTPLQPAPPPGAEEVVQHR